MYTHNMEGKFGTQNNTKNVKFWNTSQFKVDTNQNGLWLRHILSERCALIGWRTDVIRQATNERFWDNTRVASSHESYKINLAYRMFLSLIFILFIWQ